jgi:uncharacterized protein
MEEHKSREDFENVENERPTETPVAPIATNPQPPSGPSPRLVLMTLFAFSLLGVMLGPAIFQIIATLSGWDTNLLTGGLPPDASAGQRAQLRLLLGLSHFTTFITTGFITIWLFYRGSSASNPHWADYLGARKLPEGRILGSAILLMLVSLPLVMLFYNINKALPMPESFRLMEAQTNEALKSLLKMDSPAEFAANLFIIAFLPALGEELIFRGIVQKQMLRLIRNPWIGLVVTAVIFSFIHFQFEGFLPRCLLGFLLGWLYWATGNFWIPVAAHFFNNGIQVFAQYLYGQKISTIDLEQDIQTPWYLGLLSAVLVAALAFRIWKDVSQGSADGGPL